MINAPWVEDLISQPNKVNTCGRGRGNICAKHCRWASPKIAASRVNVFSDPISTLIWLMLVNTGSPRDRRYPSHAAVNMRYAAELRSKSRYQISSQTGCLPGG